MKHYKRLYKDGTRGSQFYTIQEIVKFCACFGDSLFIEYENGELTDNVFTLFELIKKHENKEY